MNIESVFNGNIKNMTTAIRRKKGHVKIPKNTNVKISEKFYFRYLYTPFSLEYNDVNHIIYM